MRAGLGREEGRGTGAVVLEVLVRREAEAERTVVVQLSLHDRHPLLSKRHSQ